MATRDDAATGETQNDEEVIEEMQDVSTPQEANAASNPKKGNHNDRADQILTDPTDGRDYDRAYIKGVDEQCDALMPVDRSNTRYNMDHKRRGDAIIIAYMNFQKNKLKPRGSAEHDVKICKDAFEKLGYVVKTYLNLKREDFIHVLDEVKNADHRDCDSLVVVFMSHGGVNEENNLEFIWTYDEKVNTSELWKNLTPEKCPSLAGKPKMFFIQACRGGDGDKGVQMKPGKEIVYDDFDHNTTDEPEKSYAIPLYADLLMMWASYPGTVAFTSKQDKMKGSVFLHFLSQVLTEDADKDHLEDMLIRVKREVALEYESISDEKAYDRNKQIPQTTSTLMRKVHFLTKQ